jgi:N-acetylglutamate synthase-like GNAT family acetyltransferase
MTNSPFNIRQATEKDIHLLVALIRTSFAQVAEQLGLNPDDHPKSTSFYTEQRMEEDFARGVQYFVLENGETAVGCVAMETPNTEFCCLMRLAVLPDYRKRRLGEQLVRHVADLAASAGLKQIRIGIVANADRLRRWYEQMGFIRTEIRRFDHLPFDVTLMTKAIL